MRYNIKTTDVVLDQGQRSLARRLSVSERFLKLLLSRGIAEEDIYAYLHPSVEMLSDALEIYGMRAAAERLKEAIEKKQKVLIYGDYDCDGICAISILTLYLKGKTDVNYFIPERNKDGYGISVGALERILKQKRPDLVITVDCGITACEEVEYLKDNGVDVIVTDHHEPQANIPDCIVVDAKIDRRGFYEYCGAGVALKLVEAAAGREEAKKYLDIAAIATVADVVPLIGQNRIIASYGLKMLNKAPRKGVRLLFGDGEITSQDIMFRIAPRINAAGRMDTAMKAVELFTESDYFLLKSLAEELQRDNAVRQQRCDEVTSSAKRMLRGTDFSNTGIIILCDDDWEAGVLGIAAAKLTEEFKRPTILFTNSDGILKGSARSVPAVNIFELLDGMKDHFISFGGHAQAAGVSLEKSKFEDFKRAASQKILSERSLDEIMPVTECEMILPPDMDFLAFAKELELMEPTGHMNQKPTFVIEHPGTGFERIGYSNHIKCQSKNLDIVGFSKYSEILPNCIGKLDLEIGLNVNCYQNNLTAQGAIKSYDVEQVDIAPDNCVNMNLHQLNLEGSAQVEKTSRSDIEELAAKPFGTLFVGFDYGDCERFTAQYPNLKLDLYVGNTPVLNPASGVILCPVEDFDYSFYDAAVLIGDPLSTGYVKRMSEQVRVLALENVAVAPPRISDDTLRAIYRELRTMAMKGEKYQNFSRLYKAFCSRYKVKNWVFSAAVKIFEELGIARISERGQLIVQGHSVNLSDSRIYRNLTH